MIEYGKKAAIDKKSYEIVYAIFRIATKIINPNIGEKLTGAATNVLAAAVAEEYGNAEKYIDVIDYLLKLSTDVDAITFLNGDLLMKEIGNLKTMIAEGTQLADNPVDISEFFPQESISSTIPASSAIPNSPTISNSPAIPNSSVIPAEAGIRAFISSTPSSQDAYSEHSEKIFNTSIATATDPERQSGNNPASGFLKSGIRQIAILDKIRQSGNCRLRDIQEVLPDTSERTIRYDLENLIERNLVERIGAGGPAISYKIRQL